MIGSFIERYSAKVCMGSPGGSSGGGAGQQQYGGRGGPKSQEQAVRDAQRHHSTGSFANPAPFTATEKAVYGGMVGGAIAGSRSGPVGFGLAVIGGAVGGYISSR
jgi:hypothetical protein